ncbi:unnamed protein product [Lampetra fluviatilis]
MTVMAMTAVMLMPTTVVVTLCASGPRSAHMRAVGQDGRGGDRRGADGGGGGGGGVTLHVDSELLSLHFR